LALFFLGFFVNVFSVLSTLLKSGKWAKKRRPTSAEKSAKKQNLSHPGRISDARKEEMNSIFSPPDAPVPIQQQTERKKK